MSHFETFCLRNSAIWSSLVKLKDLNTKRQKLPISYGWGHTTDYLAKLMSSQEELPRQWNDLTEGLAPMNWQQESGEAR